MVQEKRRILFVGGIPALMTERAIQKHFEQFCKIVKVRIMKEKKSKEPKGYAFVTLAESSVIPELLNKVHVIEGRQVDCQIASRKGEKKQWKDEQKKRRIFVSNLPSDLTSEQLKEHFSQYGEVRNAYIISDFETKVSKNYGYVEFLNPDVASLVLASQVSINEVLVTCLPYLGRHEQKNQATSAKAGNDASPQKRSNCDNPECRNEEHTTECAGKSEEETSLSPIQDKHSKYEFIRLSSRLNEAATNYRINRGGAVTFTNAQPVSPSHSLNGGATCWRLFGKSGKHVSGSEVTIASQTARRQQPYVRF